MQECMFLILGLHIQALLFIKWVVLGSQPKFLLLIHPMPNVNGTWKDDTAFLAVCFTAHSDWNKSCGGIPDLAAVASPTPPWWLLRNCSFWSVVKMLKAFVVMGNFCVCFSTAFLACPSSSLLNAPAQWRVRDTVGLWALRSALRWCRVLSAATVSSCLVSVGFSLKVFCSSHLCLVPFQHNFGWTKGGVGTQFHCHCASI